MIHISDFLTILCLFSLLLLASMTINWHSSWKLRHFGNIIRVVVVSCADTYQAPEVTQLAILYIWWHNWPGRESQFWYASSSDL